jgi:AcrR family transcriptional regulator
VTTHPTSAALHRAAVELLEQYDEDDVTVGMVLERAGASKGSLYHHYRDFDSLLDLAQATRFTAGVDRTISELGRARGRDALVGMLVRVAAGTTSAHADTVRADLLALAVRRPSLQLLLAPEQSRLTAAVASLVREGQSRCWVRADVDPYGLALLLEACAAGRVVGRAAAVDDGGWQESLACLLRTVLLPDHGGSADADEAIPVARTGEHAPTARA